MRLLSGRACFQGGYINDIEAKGIFTFQDLLTISFY